MAYRDGLRRAWHEQVQHEKARRGAIKTAFYAARSSVVDRKDLSAIERREQLSAARVNRLETEAALRDRVSRERDALKGAGRQPVTEQYQDFLRERAQTGDMQALRELRRMQQIRQPVRHVDDERVIALSGSPHTFRPTIGPEQNELIYTGPSITYEVRASGEVDYRKDGVAFLVDEGRTLRLWDSEREAIEIALRFAQQKFGTTLSLSGPEAFQAAAARVAADMRMHIVFEQQELEQIRQVRLAVLDTEAYERRTAQRERDAWELDELRNTMRETQLPVRDDLPTQSGDAEPPADADVPDGER
jgi:hypothetical protein